LPMGKKLPLWVADLIFGISSLRLLPLGLCLSPLGFSPTSCAVQISLLTNLLYILRVLWDWTRDFVG